MPAANHHVAVYMSYLMGSHPSVSKINMAVYSISWTHEIAGFPDSCKFTLVKQIKEGVIRHVSKHSVQTESLSTEDIKRIVQTFGNGKNLLDLRFVTMCLLCYARFLRFDELVNIRCHAVLFEDKQIKLYIKKCKNDQLKNGSWLVIAKTSKDTCPVKKIRNVIVSIQHSHIENRYIQGDNFTDRHLRIRIGTYRLLSSCFM